MKKAYQRKKRTTPRFVVAAIATEMGVVTTMLTGGRSAREWRSWAFTVGSLDEHVFTCYSFLGFSKRSTSDLQEAEQFDG